MKPLNSVFFKHKHIWANLCFWKVQPSGHSNASLLDKYAFLWKGFMVWGASLLAQTVKNLPANARDAGSIPGSGRSAGEGNGNPLQYACQENPMDRGAWWATVHGVAKSRTRLRSFTYLLTRIGIVLAGVFTSPLAPTSQKCKLRHSHQKLRCDWANMNALVPLFCLPWGWVKIYFKRTTNSLDLVEGLQPLLHILDKTRFRDIKCE